MQQPIRKIIVNSNIFKYEISKYLSLFDLYNFYKSDICIQQIKNILEHEMKNKIEVLLQQDLGNNYDNFVMAIESGQGMISGSSILHMIHNEPNFANDIDTYFRNETLFNQFKNVYNKKLGDIIFDLTNSINNNNYNCLPYITKIYGTYNFRDIQCIILDDTDVKTYIYNQYDYDICKNIAYFKDGKIITEFYNLDYMFTKTSNINKFHLVDEQKGLTKMFTGLEKYITQKQIKFNVNSFIDEMAKFYNHKYPNTYFSNAYDAKYREPQWNGPLIHNNGNNIEILAYKHKCGEHECLFHKLQISHYHSMSNDGRLTSKEHDNCGIYNDTIKIIHINNDIIIPINTHINTHCTVKKIEPDAYGLGDYIGKYILVKK